MKVLVPLYIYPLRDGVLVPEWQKMKDAHEGGVPIIAVANPGSGPGTEGDRSSYEKGMQALKDSGVEIVGYVASGYGKTDESEVKAHIDKYKDWYGDYLSGIFLDESAHVPDDISEGDKVMCKRYKGYREHVKHHFGGAALTVMNTGTIITEAALTDAVGDDVIWNVLENSRTYMEKNFGKVAKPQPPPKKGMLSGLMGGGNKKPQPMVGTPPAAPAHVKARAAFMVHGAPKLSYEEICHWINQLNRGGWNYVYMTNKFFDPESSDTYLHNPWDELPAYWDDLVRSVAALNEAEGAAKQSTAKPASR